MSSQKTDRKKSVTLFPKSPRSNQFGFPFKSVLSLRRLIEFWEHVPENDPECLVSAFAQSIKKELEKAPELLQPIEDLSVIEKYGSLIDALMSPVFPPASRDTDYSAAIVPFQFRPFYTTPAFDRMKFFDDGRILSRMNLDEETMLIGKTVNAYTIILKQFYNIELNFEYPLISTTQDPETRLDRHYKWQMNPRFAEIVNVGTIPPLSKADERRLMDNIMKLDVWYEIIPPENFEFRGFVVFNAVDVTDQEVLSSLKYDLIEKDAIVSMKGFEGLEKKLRALLKRPDLMLGLAVLPGDKNLFLTYGRTIGRSFILDESCTVTCDNLGGSIYERSLAQGEPVIVDDLKAYACCTPVEEKIMSQGVRNILVAPLSYQGKVVGILELASKNSGDVHAVNALKLREVYALFAMAIKRGTEEQNNQVQAVIKEKCTAIHPSVEWRFRNAGFNLLQKEPDGGSAEMEEIVFENVYPLYGLSDIRESSTLRNASIQADLTDHLVMACEIVELARTYKPLPFLDELRYRISKHVEEIGKGLSSGDEVSIIYFLKHEVESLFETLKDYDSRVREKIDAYKSAMDPELGVLYRKRKEFEQGVTMLNDAISSYIDQEETRAQEMFPHYFEKYKTDGVEHGMYIGASLMEDGKFDHLYLKNLRLWQLMMMCGVVRRAAALKERLSVPLETAHLILVQDTPLSIRFRLDEKKFDVDGAYNIRYEIMKKRIDKASVRGKKERLTQPGKIAIIYSQLKEAIEYRGYVEYLQASGYLTGEVEDVELEDLQGIQGLKALRVDVNVEQSVPHPASMENAREAVRALTEAALRN